MNGRKNGAGTYQFSNGDIYEGEFQNGLRKGVGFYKWSDNSSYRGEWD